MPLAALNRLAARRGFAFQTDAASYPSGTRLAHITNYKDQHLDRRAVDGRLGLAQALTYSLNTWFAWSGELSDASLFGRAEGGAPDLQALDDGALDSVRPIAAMAHRLGFGRALHLDGGLLPDDFRWSAWDALQASQARIDPIHTRHELRQMAIGLRMQATPLHMAMVARRRRRGQGDRAAPAAGTGRARGPGARGRAAGRAPGPDPGVSMKGVVDARHRRRRLPLAAAGGAAARLVRQDRHFAVGGDRLRWRPARAGHGLVHGVAGAGQHPWPEGADRGRRLRQPLGRNGRRPCRAGGGGGAGRHGPG
ncbi:hypothetical protein LP419_01775 [Massilia sp. H-1]|nr:hypothetical protein LP419_01775 [Massilia sp. H-1]